MYLPLLQPPAALLNVLPAPPARTELKVGPRSLVFRVLLTDGGAGLALFADEGDGFAKCRVALKGKSERTVEVDDSAGELPLLLQRALWVVGLIEDDAAPSSHEPSEADRRLAHLYRSVIAGKEAFSGVDPLVDAFTRRDWGTFLALVDTSGAPEWFRPTALAMHGGLSAIVAHPETAPPLAGHMAAFRGLARRDLHLLEAAFADLSAAVVVLSPDRRATHYRTIADLAHRMGDQRKAVKLLTWALPRLESDGEFTQSVRELLRFGGFGEAEQALAARTNGGRSNADIWLLRARLALWTGDSSAAREFVRQAETSGDADPPQTQICLAIADFLEGNDERSLQGFLAVEHLGDREAHAFSAELLKRRGEDELAITHLETASLTSQNTVHTLLRCVVYDEMQHSGRAQLAAQAGITAEAEQTVEAAREALRTFHGNRGARPTRSLSPEPVSSAGLLHDVPTPPTDIMHMSRNSAANALKKIRSRPVSEVHAQFAKLQQKYPESPHPYCYWGELLLWEGRFEEAHQAFSANRGAQIARWGYVGRAAVEVHRGDFDRALWEFAELTTRYEPVRGATTHVYMGELHRIRGEYAKGLVELAIAIGAKEARLGARANRLLCWLGIGETEQATAEFERLCDRWPAPFWHGANAVGADWERRSEAIQEITLEALAMMRGNRSSHLHTFFDESGTMRFIADAHAWTAQFARSRSHLRWGAIESLLAPAERR